MRLVGCEGCLRITEDGGIEAGPRGWFSPDRRLRAEPLSDGIFRFVDTRSGRVLHWRGDGEPSLGCRDEPSINCWWACCPPQPAAEPLPAGEGESVFATARMEPWRLEPVKGVPGLLVCEDLCTPAECDYLLKAGEAAGYKYDSETRGNSRAEFTVHQSVAESICNRIRHSLPTLDGPVSGLNPIFRCYKYNPGDVFRPHYDRSSFGAGGEEVSWLSCLIYLNQDFPGGETTFLVPDQDSLSDHGPTARSTRWSAISVKPGRGGALFFFHGDHPLSPLHEGTALATEERHQGAQKVVLRTDVLYRRSAKYH